MPGNEVFTFPGIPSNSKPQLQHLNKRRNPCI